MVVGAMEGVVHTVREVIEAVLRGRGVQVKKVLLFGSRARGEAHIASDWDFLVVVDRELGFSEKWDLIDEMKRRLARLSIPNDIIIRSEREFSESRRTPGTISFVADKEGLLV